jgi:hypothetical protein
MISGVLAMRAARPCSDERNETTNRQLTPDHASAAKMRLCPDMGHKDTTRSGMNAREHRPASRLPALHHAASLPNARIAAAPDACSGQIQDARHLVIGCRLTMIPTPKSPGSGSYPPT